MANQTASAENRRKTLDALKQKAEQAMLDFGNLLQAVDEIADAEADMDLWCAAEKTRNIQQDAKSIIDRLAWRDQRE